MMVYCEFVEVKVGGGENQTRTSIRNPVVKERRGGGRIESKRSVSAKGMPKKKKRKKRKCSEVMKEEEWKWERKSGEAKGEDGQLVRYRAVTGWYRQTACIQYEGKGRGQRYRY